MIAACFGIFICWFFRISIHWYHAVDKVNDTLYDLNFITVSDYTVSGSIKPEIYENFRESLQGKTENATHLFQEAVRD